MSIQFEWDNPNRVVTQVTQMLRERGTRIRRIPDRAIRRATFELVAIIKGVLPKVTTTLAKSVTGVVKAITADLIEGRIGSYMEYALYLEEGTGIYGPRKRPITIVAKNKKALFWGQREAKAMSIKGRQNLYRTKSTKSGWTTVASKGTDMVFRKRVTIQGIRPRHYFANAIAGFLPRYLEIIEQELAREAA